MKNGDILTGGIYQKDTTPSGDWEILKNDSKKLTNSISTTLNNIVDSNNEKMNGYKSSLSNLLTKIESFNNKIGSKNGLVKAEDDDYSIYLESRYYLEKEISELTVLNSTVSVLILTKEL